MSAGWNRSVPRSGVGLLVLSLASLLLAACGGSSSMPPPTWPKGNVVFTDDNNYTSQTSLTIPVVQTAPGVDLNICWDALMKDLLCHDFDAMTEINNVSFLQIPNMSQAQVAAKLAVGQLDENLVRVYGDYYTSQAAGSTCAHLSQFKLGASIVPATDYAEDMNKTYMLLFETGTTPGVGSRSMMFLVPTAASSVMTVNAPDACANNILSFQATLGQPMPIDAADNTKWHVDWSQITKDSFGTAVNFTKLDDVLLGFYQNMTAADLMTNFKDIELIATTLYEMPVPLGARDVDLKNAKVRNGTDAFPGFNRTDGVWAIAVRCSKCQIPAPILMTILQPQ